jgi:hypothetical protein
MVEVGKCQNPEFMNLSFHERVDNGTPLVYKVQFPDGFYGDAFEDELLMGQIMYFRPDPPDIPLRK